MSELASALAKLSEIAPPLVYDVRLTAVEAAALLADRARKDDAIQTIKNYLEWRHAIDDDIDLHRQLISERRPFPSLSAALVAASTLWAGSGVYVDGRPLYECADCDARFAYDDDEPSFKALARLRVPDGMPDDGGVGYGTF